MKALVYTDTHEVQYREEPDPVLIDDESLIKIEAVGICGSDMHAYHGHDARRVPPLILGHEAVGVVQNGRNKGRRVVLNPLITCGVCIHCLAGRSNLCEKRELIGMRRAGAFAEYINIPQHNLLNIPQDMDSVTASLTEPAATSLHAIYLTEKILPRPLSECRAVILGGGSIGVFIALILKHKGCKDIYLGDTNPLRREVAQKIGCGTIYDPLNNDQAEASSFDLVFDAVGSGRTRAASCELVRTGGIISHVGLQDNEAGLDTRKITLEEITFLGNYTYSVLDLRATIDLLASGALGALDWVDTRLLSDGAGAFREIHEGLAASPKIVLIP